MSATKASDQYACGVCTYIQSNAVKKCEIVSEFDLFFLFFSEEKRAS